MAVNSEFIVALVMLYTLYGAASSDNTAGQTSNTDLKMALIEKDMEHIKSVLNTVLKQAQSTATLTSHILELQQQANLWKNIAAEQRITKAKQQAMESTLAAEIQNVKLRDEKLQILETQVQQQTKHLQDTITKQQAVEITQATQIQELKSRDEKLNQTANECRCQTDIDHLNFTLCNLYYKLINQSTAVKDKVTDCGKPLPISHGSFSAKFTTYGSSVTYSCLTGYYVSGTPTVSCQANGKWTSPPVCRIIDCGQPLPIPHGSFIAKFTTYGSRVTYSCLTGYYVSGTSTVSCQADGKWTSPPACRIIDCGQPLPIPYGSFIAKKTTYGSNVTYSCLTGYYVSGTPTVSCQADGKWTNPPVCSKLPTTTTEVLTTTETDPSSPRDCTEMYERGVKLSGVYKISPSDNQGEFAVYCDMVTDGGGWTVFQRRQDGSVGFYRNWIDYKKGFGNIAGEFWLGNDNLHRLTAAKKYTLRVDLEDWSGVKKYAVYPEFAISDETDKYRITFGSYSGDAGDALRHNRGHKFSTKDQDNDGSVGDCANMRNGAWWYEFCTYSNLNGIYFKQGIISSSGVSWYHFSNSRKSLKMTEMKIRPAGF